jgi:hypothetical protein
MITEALSPSALRPAPGDRARRRPEKEELVCHRERRTGSTVKRTVCLTKRDAAQRRADGQTITRRGGACGEPQRLRLASANARTPGL